MDDSSVWQDLRFDNCVQKKRQKMMFTAEDDPKMWTFIAENFLNYGPFEVFAKMKEALGYEHADKSLYYRFRNILAPNLHLTNFSTETKLQIAKKFNIVLNEGFKQSLHQSMNLAFYPNGSLEDFSWRSNSFSGQIPSTSSDILLSLAAEPPTNKIKQKRVSSDTEPVFHATKKLKEEPSELSPLLIDSLKKIISKTVLDSNRKLVEELTTRKLLPSASNAVDVQNGTHVSSDSSSEIAVKRYLDGLKGLLNHLNLSELNDIRKRIDSVEEKLVETNTRVSINQIHSMLDNGLKMIEK